MNFKPDPTKQTQEVSFIRKTQKQNHPPLFFRPSFYQSTSQKHFGMSLDSQLDFKELLQNTSNKASKITSVLRKLPNALPRSNHSYGYH